MKKTIQISMGLWLAFAGYSQQPATIELDYNGISAKVSSCGLLFNDPAAFTHGFEFPKGSNKHMFYSVTDWYGGVDTNGQLRLAASKGQAYSDIEVGDYAPGPLKVLAGTGTGGLMDHGWATTDSSNMYNWNHVWVVRKTEIDSFITWYTTVPGWPGYTIPGSILDWPAHGDVSQNYPFFLAPFIDLNGDGIYNPADGDYPDIKGDFCAYTIYNDAGHLHQSSNAAPLGIEVQQMVYGYITDPSCPNHELLDQTLFIHKKVINRSTRTLSAFRMGLYADGDLGNYNDDYVGCDVNRSLIYTYNGNAVDGGSFGYGADHPAVGIVWLEGLNQDADGMDNNIGVANGESINGFGFQNGTADDEKLGLTSFGLSGSDALNTPTSGIDYYNLMNGIYTDGSSYTDPSGPTKFIYPDSSNPSGYLQGGSMYAPWSETSAMNPAGDRKMLGGCGNVLLEPGQFHEVTLATVIGPFKVNGVGAVSALQNRVDSLRNLHLVASGPCASVGVDEIKPNQIHLYPNPATDHIRLDLPEEHFQGSVYTITGELVAQFRDKKVINITRLVPGVYVVQVETGKKLYTGRIIKQ